MGEIADGMINGDFDFYTGEHLGRGYGIPRTKNKSLDWERGNISNRNRGQRYRKKTFSEQNQRQGVEFWLYDKGIKNAEEAHSIIRVYVLYKEWDDIPNKKFITKACIKIQSEFPEFIKWYNENQQRLR